MQGVYYGVFPSARVDAQGRPTAVWVVSRPHNWHPKTTLEQLLEIDLATGTALQLCDDTRCTNASSCCTDSDDASLRV